MQDSTNTQPNPTPVVTPNTGSIEGITPVQNTQTTPTILEQNNDNTVVSLLTPVASPDVQVQEAFMDQISLENSGQLDAIDTGSLIDQDNYATPKPKLRSSKIPFIITALTLVVALIIAGLGSYFAKRTSVADKSISQQIAEQSVDTTLLRVDPLSLLTPVSRAEQKLSVNGSAEFLGDITANSFSGNGSAITNLKAANCDDCVILQPNTPGLAQVGGINVAGSGLFGKLGVGTQNPAYTVDVLGDINASSSLKVNGVTVCTAAGCGATSGLTSAVTQLDGLNGNLLISNTSGSGTTITINDASTTGKGLAQFSATNFLVSGGTVNTIQDITNASIPTFGGILLNGDVTLGATGTVFSNNLSQTSAGNAVVVNAAADQITFQANGRTFQFPSTGVANQTICTTGITCVAGGGQAILLTPGSAQTDTSVDVSIFVNDTGGGNLLQLQTAGADKFVVANNGDTSINAILKVNTITPTASFTVGSSAQTITLQGDASSKLKATSGGGFTSSLGFASPTTNNTITIPDASGTVAVSASGNIILSASGNITFTGLLPIANGGTNSSTTGGALTNLGAAASGANSDITSTSALASATGLNNITPTGVFTIGATTQAFTLQGTAASIVTATSGSSSTTLGFATPTANVILNFPALSAGTYSICTNSGNCTGVGGGVSTAGGTNGTLARFNGSQVIGDSIITESGSVITIGGSEVIQGSSGLTIGTGSILGKLLFRDGSSAFADTLQSSTLTANRTVTVPNASGTLAVSASGNISLDALGNITFTGTLPLSSGGTGGTDAVTARTSLSAAMSGANSDITSLSGLTTALSVIQGGTGSTSAGGARTNLSAAQSGANGDITSTTALNTITPSTNLMVGATTQAFTLQGSTASVVTATSGGVATTLGFATPTANVTLNFPALTTGTYSICTNSGNCLGGAAGAANTALSNLTAVAINTSLLPGVAGAINLGSNSLPFGTLSLAGTSGTPGTNNFLITGTSTGGVRTVTLPDASGTVAVSASGNISLSASGNITFTGLLPIANGGTNSSTVGGALINLGAAASGANSDITSTSALASATGLNTITPTGALTVGATTQAFTLQGNDSSVITATGGAFTTTIGFSGTPTLASAPGVFYNFDRAAAAGIYTICTTIGNCAGSGGGVTSLGGMAGKLAKFTASGVIGDSIISESGVIVTVAGEAVLQGAGGLTLGQASTATGKIIFNNIGNANTVTLQSGNPGSNVTLTLPITAGANGDCITSNGSGVLSFTACTGGPGGGVTSVDGQIGVLIVANSSAAAGTITIDDATTSSKGIAQFNSTNFTASSGTINTIQNIDSTATPSFSGLVTGQAGLVVTNGGSLSTQKGTDYATTGVTSNVNLGAASLYRLTGISAQTITGFSGGVDGRILTLINAGSATAILSNLTTSAASNQISTGSGADVNLPIGSTISLIYDSAASLWRVNGTPAGSGLSGVTNDTNVTGVLASNVLTLGWTGTLAVGRGGLGVGSLASNGILYGNGSSAVQATASAANSVLITDGTSVPALSQTLPTAVQGNITSTGALNSGSITSGFGVIDNGSDTITTTGTIGTASTTTFTGNTATFSGAISGATAINTINGLVVNSGALSSVTSLSLSGSISGGTSYTGSGNINTTSGVFQLNGTDINTAGTLTNVAYLNQANIFTAGNTFRAATTLGLSGTTSGSLIFKGSGGVGTLTVAGPTTPNTSNYTLTIPAITANANICTDNAVCSGYQAAPLSGSYIFQIPSSSAANTVAPTANSVVGLTVNGTSGTAATALSVVQTGAASALTVSNSSATASNVAAISATNTATTQTDGLLINRNGAGGTTTNLLNLTNTAGTATNALTFTGTFTKLINSTNFNVTNAGAVTAVGVDSGAGLLQGSQGLTVTGAIANINVGSNFATNINTGGSNGNVGIANGTGNGTIGIGNSASGVVTLQSASGIILSTAGTVKVGTVGTPTGQLYVSGVGSPTAAGSVATGTAPRGVYVQGRYAYVVSDSSLLQIFDVTNPASPVSVGSATTGGGTSSPMGIYVQGRYAYVTNFSDSTLQIFDISNPFSPTSVGSVATGSSPIGLYVQGRYAYVTNQTSNTLQIFDISNPISPTSVGSVATGTSPRSVYVQGRYAYVTNYTSNTLQIFDIANPVSPTSVGSVATGLTPRSVYVQGRYAYVAGYGSGILKIFDISNPAIPILDNNVSAGSSGPLGVYVQGRYAYVINYTDRALYTFDVSRPVSGSIVGSGASNTGIGPFSLFVLGRYAYVVNQSSNTLQTFDIGGAYVQQLETGGIETGTLSTNGNATINGDQAIAGGLTVGQSLQVNGSASLGSSNAGTTVVLQGGTSATALNLVTGSGGTLNVGNNGVASTIQIGNTTGAVAQTISIGNNATASSSTTLVIGSAIGLSPVTIKAGTSGVLVNPVNSTTAFQVQSNASSGAGPNENPAQTFAGTVGAIAQTSYNMGYSFIPTVNGNITRLGVNNVAGTYTVTLYNQSTTAVLASASVTATGTGNWVYANIASVPVTAGTTYIVSMYTGGASGWWSSGSIPNGTTYNHITTVSGIYASGSGFPTINSGATLYGVPDITFNSSTISAATVLAVDTVSNKVSIALGATASTTAVCSSLTNSTAPTSGTAYELRDCSGAPAADYAENYPVAPGTEYGDVVAVGTDMVNTYDVSSTDSGIVDWTKVKGQVAQLVKSTSGYQSNAIGVISNNYNNFSSTGYNIMAEDNPMPVALSGRIQVKVTNENGDIYPGDFITTSATHPGWAMKATQTGYVIGQALDSYTSSTQGLVMIYVKNIYYPGPSNGQMLQDSTIGNLVANNSITTKDLSVTGTATITTLTVTGNLITGTISAVGDATVGGTLTVVGDVTLQAKLTVIGDTSVQNITINGKIITSGAIPSAVLGATTGLNATITITGNDNAGNVSYTAGTVDQQTNNTLAAGEQVNVTFTSAYAIAPRIALTPKDSHSALVAYFVETTISGFKIHFLDTPTAKTTYDFDYIVIQ